MKRCPKCYLMAPLDADTCAQCGHRYSTVFTGVTASQSNQGSTQSIPAGTAANSSNPVPTSSAPQVQAAQQLPHSGIAATSPMQAVLGNGRELTWLPFLRKLFFSCALSIWIIGLLSVCTGITFLFAKEVSAAQQSARDEIAFRKEEQKRVQKEAEEQARAARDRALRIDEYVRQGNSRQDSERAVAGEDQKPESNITNPIKPGANPEQDKSPDFATAAWGLYGGATAVLALALLITATLLFIATGGVFMLLSCYCTFLVLQLGGRP